MDIEGYRRITLLLNGVHITVVAFINGVAESDDLADTLNLYRANRWTVQKKSTMLKCRQHVLNQYQKHVQNRLQTQFVVNIFQSFLANWVAALVWQLLGGAYELFKLQWVSTILLS